MSNPNSIDASALRDACNAAFQELGLDWYWDASHQLTGTGSARDCVRSWLAQNRSHVLAAYDADFLVDMIVAAMARCTSDAPAR